MLPDEWRLNSGLKDEEMIDELNQLLSSNDDTTADNSASTDTTTAENTENN